jgi:ubiquinone/menaquinone biosynthesis C-methylase UbiE
MNPTFTDYGLSVLLALAGASYGSSAGRPVELVQWLDAALPRESFHTILDVGCFTGEFLRSLPEQTIRVGLDFDSRAIETASRLDPEGFYVQGNFESVDWEVPAPSLITMFHVIEHVRSPIKLLENMARISKPETLMVVETPILERGVSDDCHGFFSPEHLTHFSRKSLRSLVERSSWKIVDWVEPEPYNAVRLILSTKSGTEKLEDSMPTTEQSESLLVADYMASWFGAVARVEKAISKIDPAETVTIWGAGMHTEILYHLTSMRHLLPNAILVDADATKHGTSWRGLVVGDPATLADNWRGGKILISSYQHTPEIVARALSLGIPDNAIVRLYDAPPTVY